MLGSLGQPYDIRPLPQHPHTLAGATSRRPAVAHGHDAPIGITASLPGYGRPARLS